MKKISFYDSIEKALDIGEESEEEMVAEHIVLY
jgi:hypothetical protein